MHSNEEITEIIHKVFPDVKLSQKLKILSFDLNFDYNLN